MTTPPLALKSAPPAPVLPALAIKRPLVDIRFVQFALDRSEDEILWMILEGELPYVFDVKRRAAKLPCYRILTRSVADFITGQRRKVSQADLNQQLETLFPLYYNPTAAAIARRLTCGTTHIHDLMRDGSLAFAGGTWRRGRGNSPKVKRASILQFLIQSQPCPV